MDWTIALVMFGSFFVVVFAGVPISFSIGLATLASGMMMLPMETILAVVGQKMASSPDLATLPVGIFNLGLAVGILPAAYLMRRLGRQGGYIIGALLGIGNPQA